MTIRVKRTRSTDTNRQPGIVSIRNRLLYLFVAALGVLAVSGCSATVQRDVSVWPELEAGQIRGVVLQTGETVEVPVGVEARWEGEVLVIPFPATGAVQRFAPTDVQSYLYRETRADGTAAGFLVGLAVVLAILSSSLTFGG